MNSGILAPMGRIDAAWGSNDPDTLFHGAPITSVPWPAAGRRKDRKDFDQGRVNEAVSSPHLTPTDPRTLKATQGQLTYAGVSHYLKSSTLYADSHQAGNQHPVVYHRGEDHLLLSGHHRAAKALLRGEQFDAIHVTGGYGDPR